MGGGEGWEGMEGSGLRLGKGWEDEGGRWGCEACSLSCAGDDEHGPTTEACGTGETGHHHLHQQGECNSSHLAFNSCYSLTRLSSFLIFLLL